MSRVGRSPIAIPEKVNVDINGAVVTVKGPLGQLSRKIESKYITAKLDNGHVVVERSSEIKEAKAAHGLYRQLIANMVNGVVTPFSKTLVVSGVGYRAAVQGKRRAMTRIRRRFSS